ncbi:hypothetical protein AX15_002992 [Amanita polypyramis BW_CC]|nr:hypothetical protein AX15_002992 [Amanita polypyramis BW_CC]
MRSFLPIVSLACLSIRVSHSASVLIPKSLGTGDAGSQMTDFATIFAAASQINQKSGAPADAPPNQPVPGTAVTAVDGVQTTNTTATKREESGLQKRSLSDFQLVFSGGNTGPSDRDASIEGTAYLTYTVVPNNTYNVDACLQYCDSVQNCVFANLYYEFNNELLDFVFSEQSNLKCALYADEHTAVEKTNFGGQQSYPAPGPLTYIQDSSGYVSALFANPPAPEGYELVYGPTDGANNAPGYMGFAFLDRYDVDACAQLCDTRDPDPVGGACQYFNIWRAVIGGVPATYTCSMYYLVADPSTAVNYGQGSLIVTYARGYKRTGV